MAQKLEILPMDKQSNEIINLQLKLSDEWKILNTIYDLLDGENAFCADERIWNEQKIVEFMRPEELKKIIDLKIEENKSLTIQEVHNICKLVIKYSLKTTHGRFHNQLFGQIDPYGLAGSWITDALNTSSYTFEVGPVFSLIETEIIKTVCQLAGFANGDGIFAPGGSSSNMYGIVLARYKYHPDVKTSGMFNMRPLILFTSEESHYSIQKAAHWLGFGADHCVAVKTNDLGQMCADDLKLRIEAAISNQLTPFFVNATAATTVLGAFDDINAIADVCDKYKLWLHVDACLGGAVLLSNKNRHLLAGLERANSFAWNPHKTLGVPLQCSLFLTRETDLLARCNSLGVNYLFQQDKFYDISYDTGNKSVQCGRKIDAFKFWLMLKARGYGNFGRLVDHALLMSRILEQKILEREDRFRLVLPLHQYSNICFWYIPKALRNLPENKAWYNRLYAVAPKIKEQMAYSGTIMVAYTPLKNRGLGNFFRMVFTCFPILKLEELDFLLDEIERLGELCKF